MIEGNAMERHPVAAGVPQGSLRSPNLYKTNASGLINSVEEYKQEADGLSFVDDLGFVVPGCDVNHIVVILE